MSLLASENGPSDGSREQRRSFASSVLSLFASSSTLICCALPALLVSIGAGAALSSLVSTVPQLVWLSEYKTPLFIGSGLMLVVSAALQWRGRRAPCPLDPALRTACLRTRALSARVLGLSVAIYLVGASFAFIAPWLMSD